MLLFLWLLLGNISLNAQNNLFHGYLITLDGKILSGHIGAINRVGEISYLYFENDFGTKYSIRPQLIKGFVFRRDSLSFIFESHFFRRQWRFLQIIYPGREILLYQSPNIQVDWYILNGRLISRINQTKALWLRAKNQKLIKIKKRNFKRKLKRYFRKSAPELAEKIENNQYQFEDILDIVKEYTQIKNEASRKIRL